MITNSKGVSYYQKGSKMITNSKGVSYYQKGSKMITNSKGVSYYQKGNKYYSNSGWLEREISYEIFEKEVIEDKGDLK